MTVEWNTWRAVMEDWTHYVSGWENRYFVKWGLDRSGARFVGADWQWKMEMSAWLADRNVPLLAITYSNRDDLAIQTYHRATWLLTWNGRTGASIFVPYGGQRRPLDRAPRSRSAPTETRHVVGSTGVWRRNYTAGTTLVNPDHAGSEHRRRPRLLPAQRSAGDQRQRPGALRRHPAGAADRVLDDPPPASPAAGPSCPGPGRPIVRPRDHKWPHAELRVRGQAPERPGGLRRTDRDPDRRRHRREGASVWYGAVTRRHLHDRGP